MLVARAGRLACVAQRRACQANLGAPIAAAVLNGRHTVASLQTRAFGRFGAMTMGGRRLLSTTPKSHKWTMYEADPSMYLPKGSECKIVHFVRHAEGIHNAAARDRPEEFWETLFNSQDLWDSPLTSVGRQQCEGLMEHVTRSGIDVDLVIVSPLTRTLQTAALSFGLACPKAPMIASEACRERIAVYTSEGRSNLSDLKRDWPTVDFSAVTDETDPMFAVKEDDDMVGARSLAFLDLVMARPESSIAVVSHSVFLQQLYRQFEHSLPPEFYDKRQDFAALVTVAICPNDTRPEA